MFDCQYIRRALVLRQGLTLNGDNSWSTYRIHTIQCRFVHEFQARVFQHDDEDWGGVAVKEQPLSMNRGMTPISEPKEKKRTKRDATTAQNAFYNDILITNFPRFFSLLPLLFGCVKTFFFSYLNTRSLALLVAAYGGGGKYETSCDGFALIWDVGTTTWVGLFSHLWSCEKLKNGHFSWPV